MCECVFEPCVSVGRHLEGAGRFHMECLLMTPPPVTNPPPPAALGHPSAHGNASQLSQGEHGRGSGLGPLLAVDPRLGPGIALGPGLGLLGLGLGPGLLGLGLRSQHAVRGERGERGEAPPSAG